MNKSFLPGLDDLGTQTFDLHDLGLDFSITEIQLSLCTYLAISQFSFVYRVSGLDDCDYCGNLRYW